MPYIKIEDREKLAKPFSIPRTPGELNYLITQLCREYLFWKAPAPDYEPSYANHNDVIGALECAKMEFYRRVTVPYEDKKIMENTDVYVSR